jgi:hypothetical protein
MEGARQTIEVIMTLRNPNKNSLERGPALAGPVGKKHPLYWYITHLFPLNFNNFIPNYVKLDYGCKFTRSLSEAPAVTPT